jgi:hypothetical protein
MKCPNCDSEQTIMCSVAYQTGTTTGSFGGIGIDLQGDIGGFGGVKKSQTLFAKSVSPPQAQGTGTNPLGLVLLVGGALGAILGFGYYADPDTHAKSLCILGACVGIVCLIVSLCILGADHQRIMREHKLNLEKWARQWVCTRCGTRFELRDLNSTGDGKSIEQSPKPMNASWEQTVTAEDEVEKWARRQDKGNAN